MSLFIPGFAMPATAQALVDAELLALSPGVARRAADQDVRVTRAFLREQSERAFSFLYEVPGSAFATVRQRVARHLLDLASEGAPELVVSVSQQQLAEAVGTVREVIVRVPASCAPPVWYAPNETASSSSIRLGSSRNRTGTQVPDRAGVCGEHCIHDDDVQAHAGCSRSASADHAG
jgi:Crp-like helix-turn-helix domain